jgi:hypothetical protein
MLCPSRFTPANDPERIVKEAGWVSGLVWLGAENLGLTGIQFPDHPVCSESVPTTLYRPTWAESHIFKKSIKSYFFWLGKCSIC